MSTTLRLRAIAAALICLSFAAPAVASEAGADPARVEVLASQGRVGDDGARSGKRAPEIIGKPDAPARGDNSRLGRKPPSGAPAESLNQDFWIFDARTAIAGDLDRDGFYTRVELDFDADTVYDQAWVYAVLYLSLEGGPWVEYGVTDVFDIYGASGGDTYFFDADLVSGFATGYYDVLIELYDDYDGRLVADFGPAESADLFDLPLESETVDAPVEPVVIITDEGGGSTGVALLALLSFALLWRRKRLNVSDYFSVITR